MIRKFVSEIEKSINSSSIVISSNIQKYFGPNEETVYVKGHIIILDSSVLEISLYAFRYRDDIAVDKYRFHYMTGTGQILFRYDNAPHHPEIGSYPNHKHTPDKVIPSKMPSLKDVLDEISAIIIGKPI